jgi:hypothetical protein
VKLDHGGLGRDGFRAVDLNFLVVLNAEACGSKNQGEKAEEKGKTTNELFGAVAFHGFNTAPSDC